MEGERVRRGSAGDIEKLLKRKRERIEKEKEAALEEETFRRNKKLVRSPVDKDKQESKEEEEDKSGDGEREEESMGK